MPRTPATGLVAAESAVVVPGVTYWIDVNSTDPTNTGAGTFATTRQPIVFQVVGNVLSNVAGGSIPNGGTVAASYFSIWSAVTSGTFKQGGTGNGATATSLTYNAGDVVLSAT